MHPPAQTPSPSWEFQFVQVIPYNPPSHKGIPCAQYAFASLPFSYSLNCMSVYWASSGDQYILLLPAAGTLLLPAPPCTSLLQEQCSSCSSCSSVCLRLREVSG